ncbi:hypothetical protein F2P45_32410 [Massilia sp. CCM 8733]|uniref:Uncharacterized protein n=1 Tax=Massilia mucilaginosa TaxID=2609282 RepID=A0ABX0P318_9BURK|nr:hypothetical protein [Massilia mucilaginosa]
MVMHDGGRIKWQVTFFSKRPRSTAPPSENKSTLESDADRQPAASSIAIAAGDIISKSIDSPIHILSIRANQCLRTRKQRMSIKANMIMTFPPSNISAKIISGVFRQQSKT